MILTFVFTICVLFTVDLFFHKPDSFKTSVLWTLFYVLVAQIFALYVLFIFGHERFVLFQTAYWVEKSLSIDNIFVFIIIFKQFNIGSNLKKKILTYGIVGALLMRAGIIFAGIEIINLGTFELNIFEKDIHINLVLTFFGLLLIYNGIKLFRNGDESAEMPTFINKLQKILPLSLDKDSKKFVVFNGNRIFFTLPFFVLLSIEIADIVFAIDSLPAIFSIVQNDMMIFYTSNIFAILGLRSLFYVLDMANEFFVDLSYAVNFILIFIGLKILFEPFYTLDSSLSLYFVLGVLFVSILTSLFKSKFHSDL
jgi:tellurite resistance protein TerC